jgi:O-antigen ligase
VTRYQTLTVARLHRSEEFEFLRSGVIACTILSTPFIFVIWPGGRETSVSLSDAVVIFVCLLLARDFLAGRLRFPHASLCFLSVAAIAISLLLNISQVLTAKSPLVAFAEIPKVLILWIHFYVLVNLIRTRAQLVVALKAWIFAAVITALLGIGGALAYQIAGIESSFSLMYRAEGTLADCNLFAAHLGLSFLLSILYCRLTDKRPIWFFPVLIIFAAGIFFSASRGSTLAFCICLGIFFLGKSSWPVKLVGISSFALLLGLITIAPINMPAVFGPFLDRLRTTTISLDDDAAADRKVLWDSAAANFLESPLFGIGRGNFRPYDFETTRVRQTHNTYLGLLCETGVSGFAVLMTFFVLYVLKLARWRTRNPALRAQIHVLLISFLLVGLSGLTISIEDYRGVWVLIAIAEAYYRLYLTPTQHQYREDTRI